MLPSGVFFESHAAERGLVRTGPQRAWLAAFLILLAALPWLMNAQLLGMVTLAGIILVAVLGLHVTVGLAGQLNLGQSAFVGVGAFACGALAARGYSLWVCIPSAGFAAAFISLIFGIPAIRIKGFYLALSTIAAQIMFPIVTVRLPDSWFGGIAGLPVNPPLVFGISIDSPRAMYGLVLVVAVLAFIGAVNLGRSRTGRAFRAMRDNDIASSVIGVDLARHKLMAFFAGAFFAGISGALYAYYVRYVTTDEFTLWLSVWYIGMLIVGGLHSPLGAVLGVAAITVITEGVRAIGALIVASGSSAISGGTVFAATNVVLGVCIVVMLLVEPLGLAHRWAMLKAAYRIWPYPRE